MRLNVKYVGGKTEKGENKHEACVTFAYSTDGNKWHDAGSAFEMRQGKWIGAKIGFVAAEPAGKKVRGWIDADWFRILKE